MTLLRSRALLLVALVSGLVTIAAAPALAADGEMRWGHPGFAYSAPFEDLKLQK